MMNRTFDLTRTAWIAAGNRPWAMADLRWVPACALLLFIRILPSSVITAPPAVLLDYPMPVVGVS